MLLTDCALRTVTQDSEMTLRSSQQPPPRRQGGWANKVLARLVIDALGYDPSRYLAALRSPLFMRLASRDHLCPPASVHGALRRAGLLSDSASSSNGSDGPGERVVLQERDGALCCMRGRMLAALRCAASHLPSSAPILPQSKGGSLYVPLCSTPPPYCIHIPILQ
jgi:hypothetical protein